MHLRTKYYSVRRSFPAVGGIFLQNLLLFAHTQPQEYWKRGYEEVTTPNMYNMDLWQQSGHAAHYKDAMFRFPVEGQEFGMCPPVSALSVSWREERGGRGCLNEACHSKRGCTPTGYCSLLCGVGGRGRRCVAGKMRAKRAVSALFSVRLCHVPLPGGGAGVR